jgi:hypothetical protein
MNAPSTQSDRPRNEDDNAIGGQLLTARGSERTSRFAVFGPKEEQNLARLEHMARRSY